MAISLFGSIVVGFVAGAAIYALLRRLLIGVDLSTGMRIMRLQYGSVALQALGYGANDAEKTMGLIAAALLIGHNDARFSVPAWVIVASVTAFALGMAIGGVRIARTVAGKLFLIRPLHGLSFQLAAAGTVLAAAAAGGPLSTTETTASAMIGVGAVSNPRTLHGDAVRTMLVTWVVTVPSGLLWGYLATIILRSLHLD